MAQTFAYHLVETGRIRIGHRIPIKSGKNAGKPTPAYLKHFRFTSNSRSALEAAAKRYGGKVQAWTIAPEWKTLVDAPEHRWELYSESDTLDIHVQPQMLMHSTFERWQKRYCILRCDGNYITHDAEGKLIGHPCICPTDREERRELSDRKPPEACKDVSRIMVLLDGVLGGQWRINTGGFYAPAETRGTQALLASCQVDTMVIPAHIRLEARTQNRIKNNKAETLHYSTVVIEPRHSYDQLLAAGAQHRLLVAPSVAEEHKLLPEHIADVATPDDIFDLTVRIEARVSGTKGTPEQWYAWAETTFGTPRTRWTRADYERLLQAVEIAASRAVQQPRTPELIPDLPDDTNGSWRDNVKALALSLPDLITATTPKALVTRVQETCAEALEVLQQQGTPLSTGEGLLEALRRLKDEVEGQERLPLEG